MGVNAKKERIIVKKKELYVYTQAPGSKLYYEENGVQYYGIPVAKGTTLTEVVDFELNCGNPMLGLAKKLCEGNNPRNCPEMNGLFNYMKDWSGECGVVNGTWCAQGNSYTPENPPVYYAYCVKGNGKHLAKMSHIQKKEMIKEADANIPAATDLKMNEEAPSNSF